MQSYTSNDGRVWPVSDKWPVNHEIAVIRANARDTMERVIAHLDGRNLEDTFGPGTTLDEVHGNAWYPDMCSCIVHTIHHHYHPERGAIPHRAKRLCAAHAHLTDPAEHHAALLAESRHKETARALLASQLGVRHHEVEWSLNADRDLVLTHATITDRATATAATAKLRVAVDAIDRSGRHLYVVCAGA